MLIVISENLLMDFIKNGALIAVMAHGLIGVSLIWDKVLLKKRGTKNLFSYVFWLGSLSVFGLALIPFGYKSPPLAVIWIAFTAGILHLVGVFFYYVALKRGEASETLAIVGGFSPVATALIALALLSSHMTGWQLFGFLLMSAGGFMMFLSDRPSLKKMLVPVVLAAGMLGLVNVLEKVVYNQTNFVSGYVWFTIGTFVGSVALLVPASWRKQIFRESGGSEPRNRFWYFVNRIISGVGSLLIYYAVSRTHPAIVDAISGVRYVIVFIGALLLTRFRPQWLKEDFHKWQFISKSAGTLLVIAGLVLVGLGGGKKGGSGSPTASEKLWLGPRPSHSRSIRDRQVHVVATTGDRGASVARHRVHCGRTRAGESRWIHVQWMTEIDIGTATLELSSASLWRPRFDPRIVGGVKY